MTRGLLSVCVGFFLFFFSLFFRTLEMSLFVKKIFCLLGPKHTRMRVVGVTIVTVTIGIRVFRYYIGLTLVSAH